MDRTGPDAPLALLERARAGDRDAFGELAEEHRAALLRLCEKMTGSHEEAEDLVQDTLLKAFTRIEGFELRSSLRTWLFRIAMNACLDHQRAKKPWDLEKRWQWFRENGELVKQVEQTLYLSPERSTEVKEVAATCVNCIAMSLPPKQRATITLCDQMGLSREEAARAIGASVASVKTELHRARKTMAGVFESHCQLVDGQNECDGCLVGRPTAARGYGAAAALRDGVLTQEAGGALCLASTVVYNVLLLAGLRIVERHCHSVDSYGDARYFELGRDAAVEYAYRDLRARNDAPEAIPLRATAGRDVVRAEAYVATAGAGTCKISVSAPRIDECGALHVRTHRIRGGEQPEDLGWSVYSRAK
jgi:RNA polymerase sigma factor (sigma-70 family)